MLAGACPARIECDADFARDNHWPGDDFVSSALRRRHATLANERARCRCESPRNSITWSFSRISIRRIGQSPGADIILQRIKQQRRDGSIILLARRGRRSLANRRSVAAYSRLAAHPRRYDCAVEHTARNIARCSDAADCNRRTHR